MPPVLPSLPPVPSLLPFLATARLTDHHCHGVLRDGGDLESLLNEGDGGECAFDSLAGLSFRRWCPPVLDLPAHAPLASYAARRRDLEPAEVARRFLGAAGLGALCVDTGYTPADLASPGLASPGLASPGLASPGLASPGLASPAETAAYAGAAAFEVVRLEQVAEAVAQAGAGPSSFPGEFRAALAARAAGTPGVPVVGFKSIAAYRTGLDLRGERPDDKEVTAACDRWLRSPSGRLADETLHRFLIWCGADLGLPVQFHVGYGDRDIDLHKCNPLLLTDLLRALEPTGVPIMLLHNYPYHREAGYLAQVFPHVHVDLGLATHNVGTRAPEVLAEALELVPLRKFLFSSDAFGLPELYYLGALLFRRALSAFLAGRLASGDIGDEDADRLTSLITSENAARVYRLG